LDITITLPVCQQDSCVCHGVVRGASFFPYACAAQIKLHHTVRFVHLAHKLSAWGCVIQADPHIRG